MAFPIDSTPASGFHPAPGPVTTTIPATPPENAGPVAPLRAALDEHFTSLGIPVDWDAEIPATPDGYRLAAYAADRARIRALRLAIATQIHADLALLDALAPEVDPDAIHDAEPIVLAGDLARRLQAEERA